MIGVLIKSVEENETFPIWSHFTCVTCFEIFTQTGGTYQNCCAVWKLAKLLTVSLAVGSSEVSNDTWQWMFIVCFFEEIMSWKII